MSILFIALAKARIQQILPFQFTINGPTICIRGQIIQDFPSLEETVSSSVLVGIKFLDLIMSYFINIQHRLRLNSFKLIHSNTQLYFPIKPSSISTEGYLFYTRISLPLPT